MYPRLYTGAVSYVYVHKKAKTAVFYTNMKLITCYVATVSVELLLSTM